MVRRMILLITVLLFDLITSERTTKFQLQNILFEINGKVTSEKEPCLKKIKNPNTKTVAIGVFALRRQNCKENVIL